MTHGGARDTAPAVGSFSLQRAPPDLPEAVQPWRWRADHSAPNPPIITSNCPSPTPLRLRQAEPTPPPPSRSIPPPGVPLHLSLLSPTLLPPPLTVGDWARPSWLLRCRPPPPPLLHAPAPQSPPPPSGLAGSRSCACATWSAGALSAVRACATRTGGVCLSA